MSQAKTYFTLDSKVTFGTKHKGSTWREVAEKDPKWISWVIGNVAWAQLDPEIYRAIGEPMDVPSIPPEPKSAAEVPQLNMDVLGAMINACVVIGAGFVKHDSLGNMIVVPIEDPAVIHRIHSLLVEMQKTLAAGVTFTVKALPQEKTTQAQGFYNPPRDVEVPHWKDPTEVNTADDLPF